MSDHPSSKAFVNNARTGGVLYLLIIVCGIAGEFFIRSGLIVWDDAAATAGNILASQSLYRAGFVVDSIMILADVAIAVVFYTLFRHVSKVISLMSAVFRLIQAAILGMNLLIYYGALLVLTESAQAGTALTAARNPTALFFLELHSHGYDLGLIFFGISNLLLGYLLIRSNNFPSILGGGLIGGALVYLFGSYTRFVLPEYVQTIQPIYIVPVVAELSFCLWLLIKGMKVGK